MAFLAELNAKNKKKEEERRLAAMTPEERAAEEAKNRPVQTGDVNAKLA